MKTAVVLFAALVSMTILDIVANAQTGSEVISLARALANDRISVMPTNKNRGHCQPRKLRTAALPLSSGFLLPARTAVTTADLSPGRPMPGDTWTTSVPIAGHGRNLQPNAPIPLESRFCRVSSSGVSPWPRAPTERAFCAFPT